MAIQLLVLGVVFTAIGFAVDSAVAVLAGSLGDRLRSSGRVTRIINRVAGTVYLALAARLATHR